MSHNQHYVNLFLSAYSPIAALRLDREFQLCGGSRIYGIEDLLSNLNELWDLFSGSNLSDPPLKSVLGTTKLSCCNRHRSVRFGCKRSLAGGLCCLKYPYGIEALDAGKAIPHPRVTELRIHPEHACITVIPISHSSSAQLVVRY